MNPNPSSTHSERVTLITGTNIGIGRVTALRLAQAGFTVFLAGRSAQRTQAVIDEIHATTKTSNKAFFLPLQLDDLDSVRECAALFLARQLPLHLLVNNAGLAGRKGQTRQGCKGLPIGGVEGERHQGGAGCDHLQAKLLGQPVAQVGGANFGDGQTT
jgi:NAD(P)-dependent dehydrogenase (short-subunit alcohol dehydrogenase family)